MKIYSNDINEDIRNIKSFLNTNVVIEKSYNKSRSLPQFHKYQSFVHMQNYCNHVCGNHCGKCGAEHLANECTKDRNSSAKCIIAFKKHLQPKFRSHTSFQSKILRRSHPGSTFFHRSVTLSNFITNFKTLTSPLITLLSSVRNALISKVIISP